MRFSQLIVGLALCFFLGAPDAAAHHPDDDTPHIYATAWGVTLSSDGNGFYNEFARFVLGPTATRDTYVVSPYKRAMRHFRADKDSCLYPKSIDVLLRTKDWTVGDAFIESDAMLRSPVRIFSRAGLAPISATADLNGLTLGYALGARTPEALGDTGATYQPIADEEDKAKMLLLGSVDAIVANMPDALFVFRKLGSPLPAYDADYDPMPVPLIRIVCHDTQVARAFIKSFNARLQELKRSQQMAAFLKKHGLTPAHFLP